MMNTPDWDKVLGDIHLEGNKKLIGVELRLVARSAAPDFPCGTAQFAELNRILVAHGTGFIKARTESHFNWILPYLVWDFPEINNVVFGLGETGFNCGCEKLDGIWRGRAYVDFSKNGQTISPGLRKSLLDEIESRVCPMSYMRGMPTVQDLPAVIKHFLVLEYASSERLMHGGIDRNALEQFENRLSHTENLLNWAYYWLRERSIDREEIDISLGEFLRVIRSCWNVGETFKFNLCDNSTEIGSIREEAGG